MIFFSVFTSAFSKTPLATSATWCEFTDFLRERTNFDQQRQRKNEFPAMTLAKFNGNRRNENVTAVYGIAADVDIGADDNRYTAFGQMREWLSAQGWAFVLYTTTKSSFDHHRYRIVLKYEHAIDACRHRSAWQTVNLKLGGIIDPGTKDPARLSFLPANWVGEYRDQKSGYLLQPADGYCDFATSEGAPVLTSDELAGLSDIALHAGRPIKGRSAPTKCGVASRFSDDASDRPVFVSENLTVLADWHRSPYIKDWMREIANEPGQREIRFLNAVARSALQTGQYLDASLLAEIGKGFAEHGINRCPPDDLQRQAQNALKFAQANPFQPEAGPCRSDTGASTQDR